MKHYFYLLMILFWAACSKEGSSETPVLGPESFQLVYPENGETCLDGVDQEDNEASVLFRWQRSSNASSYSLVIENMSSGQKVTSNSTAPNLSQNLLKSQLYSWEVTASGDQGGGSVKSEKWSFYLAGEDQVSFGPFPPELASPRPSATISANVDGQITLSWTGSHQDDNITGYEVYIDTEDASTLVGSVDALTTQLDVNVVSGSTYYWKVVAFDSNDFKSSSGVYAFIVQ
jgi:hypothetical protein